MKIKTYPVQYLESEWQEIKEISFAQNKSIKQFIDEAIRQKVKEEKGKSAITGKQKERS